MESFSFFSDQEASIFLICYLVGVRAQVATVEQASAETAKDVESPVVIVTGASRGIGKAVALTLGKAGCKVSYG